MRKTISNAIACLAFAAAFPAGAITLGQVDDFQDGTTAEWTEGAPSPNQPFNAAGGPDGPDDLYLHNEASGSPGPGGALVMFNFLQWTGDYGAAGVGGLTMEMANFGLETLHMRIAIEGAFGTRYGSAQAAEIPADGAWHSVVFGLDTAALGLISGGDTLTDVLANVTTIRILTAEAGPDWIGDFVPASLGVDNITAVAAVPVPAALWLFVTALAAVGPLGRRGKRDGR